MIKRCVEADKTFGLQFLKSRFVKTSFLLTCKQYIITKLFFSSGHLVKDRPLEFFCVILQHTYLHTKFQNFLNFDYKFNKLL